MEISASNIIVTGSSGSFGAHFVTYLASIANKVIGLDLNLPKESDGSKSPNVQYFQVDLTNVEQVDEVLSRIFEEVGPIHGLINNAGIIHSEPLVNLLSREDPIHSTENWNKVVNINLNAVFILSSRVVHQMIKGRIKGAIINISSISAYGNAGQSAYSASKAALIGLTKTWSKELGMWGIRTNAIAPGFFETASTQEALPESIIKHVVKETPIKRMGEPLELAQSIQFILENDFLNGHVLDLNGGLTI